MITLPAPAILARGLDWAEPLENKKIYQEVMNKKDTIVLSDLISKGIESENKMARASIA